jgi:3-oxoacyl-(acyl-carrier-protein) synthase
MTRSEMFYRACSTDPTALPAAAEELAFHEPGACSGWLCRTLGLRGFHTLSTACSTGLHAIGLAKRMIDAGLYDACLALGADALSLLTVRGFASLLLVDPNGCRPFDKRRAGISLGEGAGAMLLASAAAASRVDAAPVAFAAGWGASADGHHMTAPHPEGRGAADAVASALAEAGMAAGEVDMIVAHGTGTPDNDAAEVKAMRAVFPALPPFCSMKRTLGHTLAASGALEAVLAVQCLTRGAIPPTAGFEAADESIGAAPSPYVKKKLRCVVKNSFGFGGNNAAMIFTKENGR